MAQINEAIKPWKRTISDDEWNAMWRQPKRPVYDYMITKEDWKALAIDLYFAQHGRRCVACSKAVKSDNAKIVTRDGVHYLFHETNCGA